MGRRLSHRLVAVAALLLIDLSAWTANADWNTAGGSAGRNGRVEEAMGPILTPPLWQIGPTEPEGVPNRVRMPEFGSSAAQPTAVTEDGLTVLYHLAGRYLWRATVSQRGEIGEVRWVDGGRPRGMPVNPAGASPASTPTYVPQSQMLYFGTDDGNVYGYSFERKELTPVKLYKPEDDCRFIASPLVLRVSGVDGANHDVVVIGDRPASEGTLGKCGHQWVVWGLDQPNPVGHKKAYSPSGGDPNEEFRGWITPSPLKVPGTEDQFVIGADAASGCSDKNGAHGKAMKFRIEARGNEFDIVHIDNWQAQCQTGANGPAFFGGFAGSMAADGENVYWNDTNGYLWGAQLTTGAKPAGWAANTIYLPALLAGGTGTAYGFTNTRPAVGTEAIYVTLRNYQGPNSSTNLRSGEVGASGAIIAVRKADGARKWARALPDVLAPYRNAANTDPLIVESSGLVLFGDVNGNLRAHSLGSGEPATLLVDAACRSDSVYPLLASGERPMPGARNYSQTFGTSINPTAVPPLIITGVNGTSAAEPDGFNRLVGLQVRQVYNLSWGGEGSPGSPRSLGGQPLTLSAVPSHLSSDVFLQLAESPFLPAQPKLADVRPEGVKVSWFAVDRTQWEAWLASGAVPGEGQLVAVPLGQAALPGELPGFFRNAGVFPLGASIGHDLVLSGDLPPDGYIVGVIDLERLAAGGIDQYKAMAALLASTGGAGAPGCAAPSWEMARMPDPAGGPGYISALADNFLYAPYAIAAPADVATSLTVGPLEGGELPGMVGTPATAYITLTAAIAQPVTGLLRMTVTWPDQPSRTLYYKPHTLTPTEPTYTVAVPFLVTAPESAVTVRAEFNTPPVFTETEYGNNVAQVEVPTGEISDAGSFTRGRSRVIIIPADCIPETDPSTGRLCKNYAKSLEDW